MAEAISWEIREDAKELYVTEGLTYDQVAGATGVSVSQLKKWGQVESWTAARKEYREAYSSIKRDTVMLRAKLLKAALVAGDPQSVYAFAAIEKAMSTGKNKTDPAPVTAPEKLKNINTPSDAVDALQEVVELKLNKLLAQPDILKLSQVRELKQTMELIDQMKAKYNPDAEDDTKVEGGLSDEAAEMIRQQILGVNKK
jgi:hypothetical protein